MPVKLPNEISHGVYGVLGRDIPYTLSPVIFRRVFDALQWPAVYAIFDKSARQLRRFMEASADAGIAGLSVTQPYKVKIINHLTKLDSTARSVGAVNTVAYRGSQRIGFNTDVDGVEKALMKHGKRLKGRSAVVIGAGGAARAIAVALSRRFEMTDIMFAVRDERRGRAFTRALRPHCPRTHLSSGKVAGVCQSTIMAEASLLVNATPVGTRSGPAGMPISTRVALSPQTVVFDLIYSPRRTQFIQHAQASGCPTVGGWPMLVAQANAAFNIWTGQSFPDRVNQALLRWTPSQ